MSTNNGFTLAELLIALTILGVIATFTIPKVLQSQQDTQNNAIAKEVASMVANAYTVYQRQNTPSSSTTIGNLTPYLNYVAVDTTSVVDDRPSAGTINCAAVGVVCLRLHNGGTLHYYNPSSFGGTGALNVLYWSVDPDGQASSTKAVKFFMYFNGRITTRGQLLTNSTDSSGNLYAPDSSFDPTWFSWN